MKTITLIICILVGVSVASLFVDQLNAQTVLSGHHVVDGNLDIGTSGNKSIVKIIGRTGWGAWPGLSVTADGGVIFQGSLGMNPWFPDRPTMPTFFWSPGRSALLVGNLNYLEDESQIGSHSVSLNGMVDSSAYGVAMSDGRVDTSSRSTAISGAIITGAYNSTSMSDGYIQGSSYSTSMSNGYAFGGSSVTAISGGYIEGGEFGTSMSGGYVEPSEYSTAIGGGGVCFGSNYSTAISGGITCADYSVAIGEGTMSENYRCIVLGSYNRGEFVSNMNKYLWIEEDPILIIGNGTGDPFDLPEIERRNALVIRKNGNMEVNGDAKVTGNMDISGRVLMSRQGDILMGEFGEP